MGSDDLKDWLAFLLIIILFGALLSTDIPQKAAAATERWLDQIATDQ